MSTTDDLVADLLAAIERLEAKAEAASRTGLAFVWARRNGRATMQDWLAEVANPDHVLRLCRAHRQIIDERQKAINYLTLLGQQRAHGAVVMAVEGAVEAWNEAVRALAEGYGVGEKGSNE